MDSLSLSHAMSLLLKNIVHIIQICSIFANESLIIVNVFEFLNQMCSIDMHRQNQIMCLKYIGIACIICRRLIIGWAHFSNRFQKKKKRLRWRVETFMKKNKK